MPSLQSCRPLCAVETARVCTAPHQDARHGDSTPTAYLSTCTILVTALELRGLDCESHRERQRQSGPDFPGEDSTGQGGDLG